MTTQDFIEAKREEFRCDKAGNISTSWLDTYTTELVAMVREEEKASIAEELKATYLGSDETDDSYIQLSARIALFIKNLTKHT